MKYFTILLAFFMFSNISYAQDGPRTGTEEGMKLEKQLESKKVNIEGSKLIFRSRKAVDPLWIVEGIVVNKEIVDELNPDGIAKINVLKDEERTAIYGDSGKNGVVVILLKKRYKKKFLKMMEKGRKK